jgi:hypothetical protein
VTVILLKFVKAVYNFIVGDLVILVGVVALLLALWLLSLLSSLALLRPVMGIVLVLALPAVLAVSLWREIRP